MKAWRTLLTLLVVFGMFAAACGGDDDDAAGDDATATETDGTGGEDADDGASSDGDAAEGSDGDAAADAGEIKTGGTLTYAAVGALRHLNGTVQSGLATVVPGTQVNASPLLLDENYEPQPYLAESWEISDDGLTVTLNLRDNAVFHDGVPITSEDVAFSIFTSKENHPFKPMFEPVESVDTSDPLKAVITLSKPHPAILIAMSPGLLPIIPKHIFDDGQDIQTHPRNGGSDFVGSGPFRVVEYDAAELVRLEKFDDFFLEGRPYLDEIIIDIVADPNSVIIGMDNGDYDMATNPNAAAVEQFQNDDRFVVDPKGHEAIGKISWVHLNIRSENLSTKEARQAIALAIDQQGWRDIVALGQSTPNITGIQNASPFYNPDATNFDRRDLDEAAALLESVGLADGFEVDMPADPSMLPTAEFIKQNLEDINVTLNIRSVPDFPTWAADVAAGNYDMAFTQLWNWGDPVIGVHRSYNCDNRIDPPGVIFSNNSWYCSEEVDALLDKAGSTFDNDERKDLYFQATELINEDVPVVYLGFAETYEIRKTRVQNPPDGVWGFMSPWHEVWLSE